MPSAPSNPPSGVLLTREHALLVECALGDAEGCIWDAAQKRRCKVKTLNVIADMIRAPFVVVFALGILAALVAVTIWDRMHGRKAEEEND